MKQGTIIKVVSLLKAHAFIIIILLILTITGCMTNSELVPNPNLGINFRNTSIPVMLNGSRPEEITSAETFESGQVISIMVLYMGVYPIVSNMSYNLNEPFNEQLVPLLDTRPQCIYLDEFEISEYAFTSYIGGMIQENTILKLTAGTVNEVAGE